MLQTRRGWNGPEVRIQALGSTKAKEPSLAKEMGSPPHKIQASPDKITEVA